MRGEEAGDDPSECGMVLSPVVAPAAPHLVRSALRDAKRGSVLAMDDAERRVVTHLEAGIPDALTEVGLLHVHVDLLVEEADRVGSAHIAEAISFRGLERLKKYADSEV